VYQRGQTDLNVVQIMQRAFHFLGSVDPKGYMTRDLAITLPEHLLPKGQNYLTDLRRWESSFKALINVREDSVSVNEWLTLESIRLHSLGLDICITGPTLPDPKNAKIFIKHFEQILHHAKIVMEHPAVKEAESYFTADIQFMASVYLVAVRCPHREIRRDAISLLMKSPRREGLWEGLVSGKIAELIMNIEEENGMDGDYCRPEGVVRGFEIDIDLLDRSAKLDINVPILGTDELVIRREIITW